VSRRVARVGCSVQPKDYTGVPVHENDVTAILRAAPWAPNHGKTEPWRFVVYGGERKQALLDATLAWYCAQPAAFWQSEFILAKTGQPEFADATAFAEYYTKAAADKWGKASHLVAIGVRRQRPVEGKKQFPPWEETCAVACAVQNMHLLATTLRVGAYWVRRPTYLRACLPACLLTYLLLTHADLLARFP
jgi:nitroreductase